MSIRERWSELSSVWQKELSEAWAHAHTAPVPDALTWLDYAQRSFSDRGGEQIVHAFRGVTGTPHDAFFPELEATRELNLDHAGDLGSLEVLTALPSANRISLVGCVFQSLRPLLSRSLERLDLSSSKGWPRAELRLLSHVEELLLFDLNLPDLGFASHHHGLRTLALRSQQLRSLGGLDGARLTHLGANHCSELHDLNAIWGMDSLERLHLAGTAVDDLGLAVIGSLSHLRELALRSPHLTDLTPLQGLPLTHLDIGSGTLDDSQLDVLISFDSLEHLDVVGCSLTADAMAQLRERYGEDAVYPRS